MLYKTHTRKWLFKLTSFYLGTDTNLKVELIIKCECLNGTILFNQSLRNKTMHKQIGRSETCCAIYLAIGLNKIME